MWPGPTTKAPCDRSQSTLNEGAGWDTPLGHIQVERWESCHGKKGLPGKVVACVKEILFPTFSRAGGRMSSVLPEAATSSQEALNVVSVFIQRHSSLWHFITYENIC